MDTAASAQYLDIAYLAYAAVSVLLTVWIARTLFKHAAAFLICLWALEEWRPWSYRLAGPTLAPLAERFFRGISAHRSSISAFLSHGCADGPYALAPR